MKKQTRQANSKSFWDTEYSDANHLALSDEPSEDLQKFTRWLEREFGREFLNPIVSVTDLGCGNGRNIIYLAETYGMRGIGIDISDQAIAQAKSKSKTLNITYHAQSIASPIPAPDNSQTIVLDMMTSHFLKKAERENLIKEILRVLKPNGWLFFKTFLLDEDNNAKRLLKEHPAEEPGSYIHPEIGVSEHVFTQEEIEQLLSPHFYIHKINKSHRHKANTGGKRRSISVYAQKI